MFFSVLSFSLFSCEKNIEHSVIDNTTSIEVDKDFINFRNGLYLFYDTYQEGDVLFLQLENNGVEWRSGNPQTQELKRNTITKVKTELILQNGCTNKSTTWKTVLKWATTQKQAFIGPL